MFPFEIVLQCLHLLSASMEGRILLTEEIIDDRVFILNAVITGRFN